MEYKLVGQSDINASVIGLGTWSMGGGQGWGKEPVDKESINTIHSSIDLGVNLIDTAPVYGFGRSESIVGSAIKGIRDKVIIATKCGLWWDDQKGSAFGTLDGKEIRRSLRPDTIAIEVENSLRRLNTDYIDLYQTHWPSAKPDKTPIADTIDILTKLKDQGKIRAIGISNVSVSQLRDNVEIGDIDSVQLRYSMLWRYIEKDIIPYCVDKSISILAYQPLEQGLLTGKINMDKVFDKAEWRGNSMWNPWYKLENRQKVLNLLDKWTSIAESYNCSMGQLVLAWTIAQTGITHILCGARRAEQVIENAKAHSIKLKCSTISSMTADIKFIGTPS